MLNTRDGLVLVARAVERLLGKVGEVVPEARLDWDLFVAGTAKVLSELTFGSRTSRVGVLMIPELQLHGKHLDGLKVWRSSANKTDMLE